MFVSLYPYRYSSLKNYRLNPLNGLFLYGAIEWLIIINHSICLRNKTIFFTAWLTKDIISFKSWSSPSCHEVSCTTYTWNTYIYINIIPDRRIYYFALKASHKRAIKSEKWYVFLLEAHGSKLKVQEQHDHNHKHFYQHYNPSIFHSYWKKRRGYEYQQEL